MQPHKVQSESDKKRKKKQKHAKLKAKQMGIRCLHGLVRGEPSTCNILRMVVLHAEVVAELVRERERQAGRRHHREGPAEV